MIGKKLYFHSTRGKSTPKRGGNDYPKYFVIILSRRLVTLAGIWH